jgi:hypothetical protein
MKIFNEHRCEVMEVYAHSSSKGRKVWAELSEGEKRLDGEPFSIVQVNINDRGSRLMLAKKVAQG